MKLKMLTAAAAAFTMSLACSSHAETGRLAQLNPERFAKRVMLISIDGLHEVDLAQWIGSHPQSTLAKLSRHAVVYSDARASTPSDSFPGLLAFATGASAKTTGIYYDDSYDRTYYAPASGCSGAQGIELVYDESLDYDSSQLFSGGINPAYLPLAASVAGGCKPVFPHDALKVNTIFEVVKQHGGLTAWSDKHPAYDILNGPSGAGLDDLYTPEINSLIKNGGIANGVNLAASLAKCNGRTNSLPLNKVGDYTTCIPAVEAYDETHIQAAINWVDGLKSDGSAGAGVPELFGFNLQQVSVAQKLPVGGYVDANGTPSSTLESVLGNVDQSLGRVVLELKKRGMIESTLIIIGAKHGQAPIDFSTLAMEAGGHGNATVADPSGFIAAVDPSVDSPSSFTNPNSGNTLSTGGHLQTDDVGIVWLQNQSSGNVNGVADNLRANAAAIFANSLPPGTILPESISSGPELSVVYGNPANVADPVAYARAPDIFIQPNAGVIYSGSSKKIAEHGGGAEDDTHVALLVSMPRIAKRTVTQTVSTRQVAPTILRALGYDPRELRGVVAEKTAALPDLYFDR